MSILITGGAGYIGSHIIEQLIDKKYDVVILDNLKTGYKKLINQKANFIKGDINNKKLVNNIIKQYNIQTIIHLAAYLNISEAEKNKLKYWKNNIKRVVLNDTFTSLFLLQTLMSFLYQRMI